MSEASHPALESLEQRCLLSAHPALAGVPVAKPDHAVNVSPNGAAAKGGVQVNLFDGSVEKLSKKAITLSTLSNGKAVKTTYKLTRNTTVTAGGQSGTLANLGRGQRVTLSTTGKGKTVNAITEVETDVEGQVQAVDTTNNTLTLAGQNGGAATTYTIDPSVPIVIDGQAGTLADIVVGTDAEISLSPLDGTTVLAVKVETADDQGENEGDHGEHHGLFGSVVGVDTAANTITVNSLNRWQSVKTTYNVSPTATITIDGAAGTLDQLAAGVLVVLKTDPADPTTVTSIEAVGKRVEGSVSAVDAVANTITLAGEHGGAAATYTITPTATVTIDGAAGTLAGIPVGAEAKIKLSALDNTTVISVKVETGNEQGDNGDHEGDGEHCGLLGSVASVDTAANTITVNSANHWQTTSTTYNVSPTATITIDGAAATLDQLISGVLVSLKTDPADATTVTSIVAINKRAEGNVTAVDTTASTITLTGEHNGTATTYTVSPTATITIDGVAGTLAAIPATGAEAHVKLSALDGTTVISVSVETTENEGGFGGHGGGFGGGFWHRD